MRARLQNAVPILPACDSQGQLEFAKASGKRRMPNAQRPTRNGRARPPGAAAIKLRSSYSWGIINCPYNRADDNHLDEPADDPANDQLSWKRIDRLDRETAANC